MRTEIAGFDLIANGGLPQGRVTLLSGTSGNAKTVFAVQFLASGILQAKEKRCLRDVRGVSRGHHPELQGFRLEHRPLGSRIPLGLRERLPGAWRALEISGSFDLDALIARIEHAVHRVKAKRVSLDSLGGIFAQFDDEATIRHELFRITSALKKMGVTSIITAERIEEYGPVSRFGIEEFVSDNVIIFRNTLLEGVRRRTVEILKFRGATHQKGEWPLTIVPDEGIVVIPLSAIELQQKSSEARLSTGNRELDSLCGGGFFRDSVILVSGPTGTGKTLITTEFVAAGVKEGQRSLLFAFEESREQLYRNARGWGIDFEDMEARGLFRVLCEYPEAASIEDHLIRIKKEIEEFNPDRVAIDSLSALECVASDKGFREFAIALTSYIKHREIPGLYTATTSTILGGTSITETHISTITDTIILLRYVEKLGQMRRGLGVLKMRGSYHNKDIREFTIDESGLHIEGPFRSVFGILSGNFRHVSPTELRDLSPLLLDESKERVSQRIEPGGQGDGSAR